MKAALAAMPTCKGLVLDLDGTLIDTLPDITDALNLWLHERGLASLDTKQVRGFIGGGTRAMLRTVSAAQQLVWDEAWHGEYLTIYEQGLTQRSRPFTGVLALLEQCQAQGLPMSIVTNKSQAMAIRIVETLLPGIHFAALVGATPYRALKPDPQGALVATAQMGVKPHTCLMVGDTSLDVLTARAAGMRAGAALWGYEREHELLSHAPHLVFKDPGALAKFLVDRSPILS